MGPLKKAALGTALLSSLASMPLMAYEAGDLILRAGAAGVFPNTNYDDNDLGGAGVDVNNTWSLGLTGTYMVSNNFGVGLLAAWPFEHDIDGDGALSSNKVGSAKQLPPTLTAQWYFTNGSNIHPYVGAGINYTIFFNEDTTGALNGVDMELDDSWGLAGEVGVDIELDGNWIAGVQLWYIDINTQADLKGVGKLDVDVDPWVFMLGIGKKF